MNRSTGVVEPMRTEDDHQQRGLARHILTTGIDRLVEAGAGRIKICFDPDNEAASHLYLSVGFEPVKQTDVFSRRATVLRHPGQQVEGEGGDPVGDHVVVVIGRLQAGGGVG